ncbi:MAG: helix-turn-helix domain-containing protein [Janthinobacterium lividum]
MAKHNYTRSYAYGSPTSTGHFVRTELGLTQQELAWLLGVSRVALAKEEGNSRQLPPDAMRRLLDVARLLHTLAAPASPPPLPPPDAAQRETLALRLLAIQLAEYPVRQELARQQQRLAQFRRRTQAAPAIQALLPAEATHARQALDSLLRQADGYLALDATEPLLPELRLRVLAFERAEIERILAT